MVGAAAGTPSVTVYGMYMPQRAARDASAVWDAVIDDAAAVTASRIWMLGDMNAEVDPFVLIQCRDGRAMVRNAEEKNSSATR